MYIVKRQYKGTAVKHSKPDIKQVYTQLLTKSLCIYFTKHMTREKQREKEKGCKHHTLKAYTYTCTEINKYV
jgi:hypothetical protein